MPGDPYSTLGVNAGASDDELHAAYRRLVKLHHPDHNGGSEQATRRFQEIQQAYNRVKELRKQPQQARRRQAPHRPTSPPPPGTSAAEDDVASRMADLERELHDARTARDRARQAARDAVADSTGRPSDEELGYVNTDDSFSKILSDARSEVADRLSGARQHPAARRVADLIDGLDDLASKFTRRPPQD
jgi:curved DNA-binding protein CbpA